MKRPPRRPKSPEYALLNRIELEDAAYRCTNVVGNNLMKS